MEGIPSNVIFKFFSKTWQEYSAFSKIRKKNSYFAWRSP